MHVSNCGRMNWGANCEDGQIMEGYADLGENVLSMGGDDHHHTLPSGLWGGFICGDKLSRLSHDYNGSTRLEVANQTCFSKEICYEVTRSRYCSNMGACNFIFRT